MYYAVVLGARHIYHVFFFQAEDGIRDLVRSRGLGDVYKRQGHAAAQRQACAEGHAEDGSAKCHRCLLSDLLNLCRLAEVGGAALRDYPEAMSPGRHGDDPIDTLPPRRDRQCSRLAAGARRVPGDALRTPDPASPPLEEVCRDATRPVSYTHLTLPTSDLV